MRKLVLCSFKAKTGDYEFEDYRLVAVNYNEGETETDLMLKATRGFEKDFPNYFPDSELLSALALPTMGSDPEKVDDRKVLYSEERLIAFGNTLLERVERDVRPYVGKADRVDPTVFKVNASDLIDWKEKIKE